MRRKGALLPETKIGVFMRKELFGLMPGGAEVYLYSLRSEVAEVKIMNKGATVQSFTAFGTDVVGGFDTLADYLADDSHQGGTIGRVANRIEDAEFTLDGAIYMLPDNDNGNCLHGGAGFDTRMWAVKSHTEQRLVMEYYSPDGEEGFPAGVLVEVTFELTGAALKIKYRAMAEEKTPIALTNHSYFNLDGFGGTIASHKARIYADRYTEVDERLIPTGRHPSVSGTVFDFREMKSILDGCGDGFDGYDHNFVLTPTAFCGFDGIKAHLAATVEGDKLILDVYTDQEGVQFYIGNFLGDGPDFKGGVKQIRHGAFCLETQTEPNCVKHGGAIYGAGEVYTHICVYEIRKK